MDTDEHGFRDANFANLRERDSRQFAKFVSHVFHPCSSVFIRGFFLFFCFTLPLTAQEKVTFQDHVLPVVEANCAKCHNSDKKKGDLDLTSYGSALAGGASGKVVVSGDVDASKLWKVINHLEDPNMPPNRGKMADKELATFKKWIAGGLLETL